MACYWRCSDNTKVANFCHVGRHTDAALVINQRKHKAKAAHLTVCNRDYPTKAWRSLCKVILVQCVPTDCLEHALRLDMVLHGVVFHVEEQLLSVVQKGWPSAEVNFHADILYSSEEFTHAALRRHSRHLCMHMLRCEAKHGESTCLLTVA